MTTHEPDERTDDTKQGTASRIAETAVDVAIGGGAFAADKLLGALDKLTERGEHVVRDVREAVDGSDARRYEERTRDELYALATERRIRGRSSMRKAELIAALRSER